MTKDMIKKELDTLGVRYTTRMSKETLLELLKKKKTEVQKELKAPKPQSLSELIATQDKRKAAAKKRLSDTVSYLGSQPEPSGWTTQDKWIVISAICALALAGALGLSAL